MIGYIPNVSDVYANWPSGLEELIVPSSLWEFHYIEKVGHTGNWHDLTMPYSRLRI